MTTQEALAFSKAMDACMTAVLFLAPLSSVLINYGKESRAVHAREEAEEPTELRRRQLKQLLWRRLALCLFQIAVDWLGAAAFSAVTHSIGTADFGTRYLEGGIIAGLLLPPIFVKLAFPKGTSVLDEIAPLLLPTPLGVLLVKIGCLIEQQLDGKAMRWGMPVWPWNNSRYYEHAQRIFPYNAIYVSLMVLAVAITVILWVKKKPTHAVLPLFCSPMFFSDFFIAWNVGKTFHGLSVMHFAHLILFLIGIGYLFAIRRERRERARKKEEPLLNSGGR